MTILDEIASYAKLRVETAKRIKPLAKVKEEAESLAKGDFPFEKALQKEGLSFICECKKASPSKGLIAADFPYVKIAEEYEAAGADCISVLTEPKWFLGKDSYLKEITQKVKIPCLRKDFTVDEYMIYEAKTLGASAVLLICAILTDEEIKSFLAIADSLGLSAIVEAHNEEEIKRAIALKSRIIGVNNRNLKDFSVNTKNSEQLRTLIPKDILFISESGIKDEKDIEAVRQMQADGVLIGEALMRSDNIKAKLKELRG